VSNNIFSIKIEDTKDRCPIGETVGERNIAENKIPVLSCEGACIRGVNKNCTELEAGRPGEMK